MSIYEKYDEVELKRLLLELHVLLVSTTEGQVSNSMFLVGIYIGVFGNLLVSYYIDFENKFLGKSTLSILIKFIFLSIIFVYSINLIFKQIKKNNEARSQLIKSLQESIEKIEQAIDENEITK